MLPRNSGSCILKSLLENQPGEPNYTHRYFTNPPPQKKIGQKWVIQDKSDTQEFQHFTSKVLTYTFDPMQCVIHDLIANYIFCNQTRKNETNEKQRPRTVMERIARFRLLNTRRGMGIPVVGWDLQNTPWIRVPLPPQKVCQQGTIENLKKDFRKTSPQVFR